MRRRARRAVAASGVLMVLAACGSASTGGTSLQGTRAVDASTTEATAAGAPSTTGSSVARTTAVAGVSTTSGRGGDVTLAGGSQITAAGGTTTAPAATTTVPIDAPAPAGFKRAADPAGAVSIAVPLAWTIVALDDRTLEELANQGAAFPAATREQLQNAVAQAGDYMKVLAVGPADASGLAPTANVVVVPGSTPLSILRKSYPEQVKTFGATVTATEDLTVDGRAALRFALEIQSTAGVLKSSQVIVPASGSTIILSTANAGADLEAQIVATVVIPRR